MIGDSADGDVEEIPDRESVLASAHAAVRDCRLLCFAVWTPPARAMAGETAPGGGAAEEAYAAPPNGRRKEADAEDDTTVLIAAGDASGTTRIFRTPCEVNNVTLLERAAEYKKAVRAIKAVHRAEDDLREMLGTDAAERQGFSL